MFTRAGLAHRAQLARRARTGNRLIIFDPALQPEDQSADWRLVMLGDMRQRVSLVPFDWAEIARHAKSKGWFAEGQILKDDVDQASYRMHRAIGAAAQSVFSNHVIGKGRRQHGRYDPDALKAGGTISVIVSASPWATLADYLR